MTWGIIYAAFHLDSMQKKAQICLCCPVAAKVLSVPYIQYFGCHGTIALFYHQVENLKV